MKGFRQFILRGNVVDLAVAVVIGAAFGAVVTALVKDLITPIISIPGSTNFSALTFKIRDSEFFYGDFINTLISFLSIAAAIFFFVVNQLNMLAERRKRGDEPAPPELTLEQELLSEIRDLLKSRAG